MRPPGDHGRRFPIRLQLHQASLCVLENEVGSEACGSPSACVTRLCQPPWEPRGHGCLPRHPPSEGVGLSLTSWDRLLAWLAPGGLLIRRQGIASLLITMIIILVCRWVMFFTAFILE